VRRVHGRQGTVCAVDVAEDDGAVTKVLPGDIVFVVDVVGGVVEGRRGGREWSF
jgi:hypothetical protein